jgi:hypothetical protein
MGGNAILFYHLNLLSAKEYTVELGRKLFGVKVFV